MQVHAVDDPVPSSRVCCGDPVPRVSYAVATLYQIFKEGKGSATPEDACSISSCDKEATGH